MPSRNLRLETDSATAVQDRGRLLYVEDIDALLRGKKTPWWIRHRFAPSAKQKIGRTCAWFERDALEWIVSQRSAP
jgi:hypothetical protein